MTGPSKQITVDDEPAAELRSKGHLASGQPIQLTRLAPRGRLAALVRHYWIPRWNLAGGQSQEQHTLDYPAMNLVIEPDTAGLYRSSRARASRTLAGTGWALGVLLQPDTGRMLAGRPARQIPVDGLPLSELAVPGAERMAEDVRAASADDRGMVDSFERWLDALGLEPDANAAILGQIVHAVETDRSLSRVDALADRFGLSVRQLQRLVADGIGYSPKWLIRRYRLQDAAAALSSGVAPQLVDLSVALGYADQAHFSREFKSVIGMTPRGYLEAARRNQAASPASHAESLLERWGVRHDGDRFQTATSILVPGVRDDEPVMLKLAIGEEEARGNRLMTWWDGRGAARVLERSGDAVLLERAIGSRSLVSMARAGGAADDAATRVMCEIAAHLHAVDAEPPAGLIPLQSWFRELFDRGRQLSGFHARAAERASELLAAQREIVVLHGDLHHGNVLDFGMRRHSGTDGWGAIDPKFLIGDRAFDFANILCNPDGPVAERPGRLARQVDVISRGASIEGARLLGWTVAWCALSDSWFARDGIDAPHVRRIGEEAERMLR